MTSMIGGWDRADVAQAQQELVTRELSEADTCGPYKAFLWAMDTIGLESGRLLDVGCGVGHYGVLCEKHYPKIRYVGTDLSEAMIANARALVHSGIFFACQFEYNDFSFYDIVLASQVLEMTDDPPSSLDYLLSRFKSWAILNRIRLTPDKSHRITETTYCGQMGQNWLWNQDDIMQRVVRYADIVASMEWNNQMTLVLRKPQ